MKPYSIDTSLISLEDFKVLTANKRMLPSRIVLHEKMDARFSMLKSNGLETLGDLIRILGSKSKIQAFSVQSGLSEDYLVILKREAGSYIARPFSLSSFPGIPFEYVELLKSRGIKNTSDLFEGLQSEKEQKELSDSTGIPAYRLKELYVLCDLSRITGVGGIFARVLYEAGIRSSRAFAETHNFTLLRECQRVIEKHGYAVGKLGEKDMDYGIHYARLVVSCDHPRDKL